MTPSNNVIRADLLCPCQFLLLKNGANPLYYVSSACFNVTFCTALPEHIIVVMIVPAQKSVPRFRCCSTVKLICDSLWYFNVQNLTFYVKHLDQCHESAKTALKWKITPIHLGVYSANSIWYYLSAMFTWRPLQRNTAQRQPPAAIYTRTFTYLSHYKIRIAQPFILISFFWILLVFVCLPSFSTPIIF